MDNTPTPFTDLLRLWRRGWLLHAATLREAALQDAWSRDPAPAARTRTADCYCLPACC